MTLNAVIALILHYFAEFNRFSGRLYHSEDRPIMSVKYCLPVPVLKHFWRKLQRTLQRGLSAIAEHLVYCTDYRYYATVFIYIHTSLSIRAV